MSLFLSKKIMKIVSTDITNRQMPALKNILTCLF
jgi:hypothetical protein